MSKSQRPPPLLAPSRSIDVATNHEFFEKFEIENEAIASGRHFYAGDDVTNDQGVCFGGRRVRFSWNESMLEYHRQEILHVIGEHHLSPLQKSPGLCGSEEHLRASGTRSQNDVRMISSCLNQTDHVLGDGSFNVDFSRKTMGFQKFCL